MVHQVLIMNDVAPIVRREGGLSPPPFVEHRSRRAGVHQSGGSTGHVSLLERAIAGLQRNPCFLGGGFGYDDSALRVVQAEVRHADEPNFLDEADMLIFGKLPLEDPLFLVTCNICQKPLKASHFSQHMERCHPASRFEQDAQQLKEEVPIVLTAKSTKRNRRNSQNGVVESRALVPVPVPVPPSAAALLQHGPGNGSAPSSGARKNGARRSSKTSQRASQSLKEIVSRCGALSKDSSAPCEQPIPEATSGEAAATAAAPSSRRYISCGEPEDGCPHQQQPDHDNNTNIEGITDGFRNGPVRSPIIGLHEQIQAVAVLEGANLQHQQQQLQNHQTEGAVPACEIKSEGRQTYSHTRLMPSGGAQRATGEAGRDEKQAGQPGGASLKEETEETILHHTRDLSQQGELKPAVVVEAKKGAKRAARTSRPGGGKSGAKRKASGKAQTGKSGSRTPTLEEGVSRKKGAGSGNANGDTIDEKIGDNAAATSAPKRKRSPRSSPKSQRAHALHVGLLASGVAQNAAEEADMRNRDGEATGVAAREGGGGEGFLSAASIAATATLAVAEAAPTAAASHLNSAAHGAGNRVSGVRTVASSKPISGPLTRSRVRAGGALASPPLSLVLSSKPAGQRPRALSLPPTAPSVHPALVPNSPTNHHHQNQQQQQQQNLVSGLQSPGSGLRSSGRTSPHTL
eukprot:TRINITY_DN17660_c1_g1_i1.p1 TRINITY_DN17660_c1_g1~~TRINITY_DN17660_c1_g1_i1.p1  ORF type:complete len:687 (-),score=129.77 TRINITY_DN17660_c1_g1_i1:170-2230(-)